MYLYFCNGELAEWSNALVLKTSVPQGTESSNLSFSATFKKPLFGAFLCLTNSFASSTPILRICSVYRVLKLLSGWYSLVNGRKYSLLSNF